MSEGATADDLQVEIVMSPNQLHGFFEKLAHDDEFRARLEANPVETLAEHGIQIQPGHVPETIQLPDKTELQDYMATWQPTEIFPLALFNYVPFLPPRRASE